MSSSIPADHWSRNLKTDTVAHILSFLDEDAMVRWEDAEGGFELLHYVDAMNEAISRQWKNLYDTDRKFTISRWAHRSSEDFQSAGKEYVKECRRTKVLAGEAQKFYDFRGKAGPVALFSEGGFLTSDLFARRVPVRQSAGESPPSLSWDEWTMPTDAEELVFVTITRLDTQQSWHGYRKFEYFSTQPLHFRCEMSLGLAKDLAEDLDWPDLKEVVQDWESVGTKLDLIKSVMENMQVTITTCGNDSGVMISTGGFDSIGAVFGGRTSAQFHERHPESPTADEVSGVMNSFNVKMFVRNGDFKLDVTRQIEMQLPFDMQEEIDEILAAEEG